MSIMSSYPSLNSTSAARESCSPIISLTHQFSTVEILLLEVCGNCFGNGVSICGFDMQYCNEVLLRTSIDYPTEANREFFLCGLGMRLICQQKKKKNRFD